MWFFLDSRVQMIHQPHVLMYTSASHTCAHVSQNICVHWYVRVKIYQYISVHVDHYVERAQTYWRESCRKEKAKKNPPRVCKYTYIHQPVKNGKYVNTSKNKFALISICKCAYILAGELLKRRRQPKTTCRPDAELHVNIYTDIHMYIYRYIYIIYIYHTSVYANIYLCIHIYYAYTYIYTYMSYTCTWKQNMHVYTYIHTYVSYTYMQKHTSVYIYTYSIRYVRMRWLRLVGSLKLYVHFAKEPY
jgi:hypothetical protein